MVDWRTIAEIRREYGDLTLNEENVQKNPFLQFKVWFDEVLLVEKSDPTAMVLSTSDKQGKPDSRVVLLKGIEEECFIFYTNYESSKARQLEDNPFAALNFYWPQMARQVRIRGAVQQISAKRSDTYFASRPVTSQVAALVSPQSKEIATREELDRAFNEWLKNHQEPVVRPQTWGGYAIIPDEIEFWQGRDNRMHDRMHFYKEGEAWICRRLAP